MAFPRDFWSSWISFLTADILFLSTCLNTQNRGYCGKMPDGLFILSLLFSQIESTCRKWLSVMSYFILISSKSIASSRHLSPSWFENRIDLSRLWTPSGCWILRTVLNHHSIRADCAVSGETETGNFPSNLQPRKVGCYPVYHLCKVSSTKNWKF